LLWANTSAQMLKNSPLKPRWKYDFTISYQFIFGCFVEIWIYVKMQNETIAFMSQQKEDTDKKIFTQ
jgi:hypothetical protein